MMCKKHDFDVRFDLTVRCALCTLFSMENEIDIKALRLEINWKQDKLARFLGVDRSSIAHMENGRPIRGPVKRLLLILMEAAKRGDAEALFADAEQDNALEAAE
jgi:DNA-binding transcriptional regulator YiaG